MRGSIRWVLLSLIVVTGWSFGQPATEKPAAEKPPPDKGIAARRSLDDQLAAALRHSPDVQVADAKVRAAQAEMRRVRLTLIQKVIEANAAVDASRTAVMHAEDSFRRTTMLIKTGNISAETAQDSEGKLAAAKAQLAQAETTLNALIGNLPGAAGAIAGDGAGGPAAEVKPGAGISGAIPGGGGIAGITGNQGRFTWIGDNRDMPGGNLGMLGGNLGALGGGVVPDSPPVRAPSAPMSDKLRKALDATVKVGGIKDKPLAEVVTSFRPAAGGVPFLLQLGDKANVPVNLALDGNVQLGAVFQALEDVVPGLKCYVREYGILVTMDDNPIQEAMPLIEFWQQKPGRR